MGSIRKPSAPPILSRQNLTVEQAVEKPKVSAIDNSAQMAAKQAQTRAGGSKGGNKQVAQAQPPMAARQQALRGKGRR